MNFYAKLTKDGWFITRYALTTHTCEVRERKRERASHAMWLNQESHWLSTDGNWHNMYKHVMCVWLTIYSIQLILRKSSVKQTNELKNCFPTRMQIKKSYVFLNNLA